MLRSNVPEVLFVPTFAVYELPTCTPVVALNIRIVTAELFVKYAPSTSTVEFRGAI